MRASDGQVAPTSTPKASKRNGLVDYGRLVAALGIVWFHSQAPGTRIAYASLPFFLVLLAMPSSAGIATRFNRLMRPFLIWSVIYAAVKILFAAKNHQGLLDWWQWHMVLTGTSLHLWFLPFAFLISLLSPALRIPAITLPAIFLIAGAFIFLGTPTTVPLAQWSFGIIPVFVGFAYFVSGWKMATSALVACYLLLVLGRPSPDNITILVGTALALLCLTGQIRPTGLSAWCARLSTWVYLAHPLTIIAGRTIGLSGVPLAIFSTLSVLLLAQAIESGKGMIARKKAFIQAP